MQGFLERFVDNFRDSPLGASFYVIAVAALCLSAAWSLWKKRPDVLFWTCFGLVATPILLTSGDQTDDARHHVYRIIGLADQIRSGHLSLMFQNDVAGETLPVFLFYSLTPYLAPVALNLLGVKAAFAYKVVLIAYLGIFAAGFWRIACAAEDARMRARRLWAGCLLLMSTYVFANWVIRSAYGEISVYAFIPWAMLYAGGPHRSDARLLAVFALQTICHPIVVAHSMVAQSVGGYALSREKFWPYWLRVVGIAIASFLIASPFWAPQVIWEHTTLGARALTLPFTATFLPPSELLSIFSTRIVGLALMLAAVIATVVALRTQAWKALLALGLFWLLIALQTTPLTFVTVHIPVLDKGQLVWRIMFVCAVLAYAALLTVDLKWARALCALALVNMLMFVVGKNVNHSAGGFLIAPDRTVYMEYSVAERPFGGLEFYPDYKPFRTVCSETDSDRSPPWSGGVRYQELPYSALRAGVVPDSAFIQVRGAPYDYVSYKAGGQPLAAVGVCRNRLVLGPIASGATVKVDETKLQWLLWVRLALAFSLIGLVAYSLARLPARRSCGADRKSAAGYRGRGAEQELEA